MFECFNVFQQRNMVEVVSSNDKKLVLLQLAIIL